MRWLRAFLVVFLVVFLAVLLLAASSTPAAAGGTIVLRGGAIYTMDPAHPRASALVIQDGRIAYVGDEAGARAFATPGARVVALGGRAVLPGLHDSHVHPMSGGMRLLRCRLDAATNPRALDAAVRACASRLEGAWLLGGGWTRRAFGDRPPSREKLDELVPERPAFLTNEDGFAGWVNTRARTLAGLDPDGPGLVEGEAAEKVRQRMPQPSEAELREALHRATAMANRFGITSIVDAAASPALVDAYRAADQAGELTVRVVAAQRIDPQRGAEQVDEMVARRDRVRGRRFRADAAKLFLDGEIVDHTAAMLAPYADSPERGKLFFDEAVLRAIVRRLDAEGFFVHMHAMGDAAVRAGLDAFDAAIRDNGPRDRRHQIAHLGAVAPDDVRRFGALGVAADLQPIWAQPSDAAMAPSLAALGPARARWMYPMAAVAAAGGRVLASSDWPSPSMNPFDAIQVAVASVTLDAILAAYTRDAAWAAGEDREDGTLTAGKAADLIVLDRDPYALRPRDLHRVRVLLTLIDGEPVHRDPHFSW